MNYEETVEALNATEDELVEHLISSVEGGANPGDTIRAGLVIFGLYDSVDMPYADTDYVDDYKLIDSFSNLAEWFPKAPLEKTAELVCRYMGYVLLEFTLGQNIDSSATWTEVSVALSTILRRKVEFQYELEGIFIEEEEEEEEEEYEDEDVEEEEEEEEEATGTVTTLVEDKPV